MKKAIHVKSEKVKNQSRTLDLSLSYADLFYPINKKKRLTLHDENYKNNILLATSFELFEVGFPNRFVKGKRPRFSNFSTLPFHCYIFTKAVNDIMERLKINELVFEDFNSIVKTEKGIKWESSKNNLNERATARELVALALKYREVVDIIKGKKAKKK